MDTLDPMVMLAIFLEMLGPLLWVLLAIGILASRAFAWVIVRERGVVARRLVASQALGLLGGAGALVLMARVSSSGFTDAGGPIDWLLIAAIFLLGMLYTIFAAYAVAGWFTSPRTQS